MRSTRRTARSPREARTAAGVDLCLELVRQDHGTTIAAEVARRLVVPPARARRPGAVGLDPAVDQPDSALVPLPDRARSRMDQQLSFSLLARRADTTRRTLTRRLMAEPVQGRALRVARGRP